MSYENWKDKIGTFEVMDVRGKKMDFFPALKAKAAALKNGDVCAASGGRQNRNDFRRKFRRGGHTLPRRLL